MMFFSSLMPGQGVVVKSCKCGRKFTADDWMDLPLGGFMEGSDDDTTLGLRHCPCKSTLAMKARFYKRPIELWFITNPSGELIDVLEVRDAR